MQKAQGVILKNFPYREYDQILHCFTEDAGLVKILFKGSRSKRRGIQGICTPLNQVELIYKQGRGDLGSGIEISLLNSYQAIRKNFDCLNAACQILSLLSETQLPEKPAPLLYALATGCLDRIPRAACPHTLSLTFFAKLLRHEGILSFPLVCASCGEALLNEAYFREGEWVCYLHKMFKDKYLKKNILTLFYQLGESRSFKELEALVIPKEVLGELNQLILKNPLLVLP
ncbi:MAG: DNA repair protein RecO [Parachlamydia sp.]|jgi:DNA repair protein RecO (recombination protein O)|nr:DNA repair protein RecO [Parachlamydia sp.]